MKDVFEKEIYLENKRAIIRPIELGDLSNLMLLGDEPDLWSFFNIDLTHEEAMKEWIEKAVRQNEEQSRYTLLIFDKNTGEVAGSASYGNIHSRDRRLEIGRTWLGKKFHGSGLNKNIKFLMLEYAFEELEAQRVEFKTDVLNDAARKSLIQLGAVEEGILRSHTIMPGHRRRDTIYYSILAEEWEAVKEKTGL